MPKYFVVFTEESTKDHGYYVEAKSKQQAHKVAEKKYMAMEEPDSLTTSYSETLDSHVEGA